MQRLELATIVVAVLCGLTLLALRELRSGRRRGPLLQLMLGGVLGLLGAFIVLVTQVDLVPDDLERAASPALIVGVSLAAIAGSWYRLARR